MVGEGGGGLVAVGEEEVEVFDGVLEGCGGPGSVTVLDVM